MCGYFCSKNMTLLKSVVFLLIFACIKAQQHKYTVLFKSIEIEYVDNNSLDVHAVLYNVNKTTKAVNLTLTLKIDLPDDTKIMVRAMKWRNGDYHNPLQGEKRIKDALEMEAFGIQKICTEDIHPPAVWPLRKKVTYRLLGWVPDSSTYPANIPEGKWKLQEIVAFPNKTKLLVANWFSEVQYRN